MAKFKMFSSFVVLSLMCTVALAQTQDSYDYHSEFTWGINKNTYSGFIGGLFFKSAKRLNDKNLRSYGLEIINVKNPQEVRRTSLSGNQFLYGKSNYLYAIRPQIGLDHILFKKAPQQGAEIKAVFAAGPTFGVVMPYYVQISNNGGDVPVYEKYTPAVKTTDIDGAGRPFQGLSESKIQMGINLKAAINFEIGAVKSSVTGFEGGFLLDAYAQKVIMVPAAKNYAIYPTFFIAIFYGSRR
ncbi:MAG TPA: hypothetical protein VL443_25690 [Cyclobacteriaceae bacterium]|nr:hypothetical protein [Cyclobacteriaceae bacterium]